MDEFVAYPSRWRRVLLAIVAVVFVLFGFMMVGAFGPLSDPAANPPAVILVFGWLAIVFFGFCGVVWIARLFDTAEQLRIDAMGVRYAAWSRAMMPWQDITNVTIWSSNRQRTLVLHLRDPARYPGKGLAALFATINRKLTGGDVSISLTGTDRSFDDALSAIAHFRRV